MNLNKLKIFIIILLLIIIPVNTVANDSSTIIFVLDTGLNYNKNEMPGVKPYWWFNITDNTLDITDTIGHGTNILMIIQKSYKNAIIIPIKITNKEGETTYYDIISSLLLINKLKESRMYDKNIIINLSFTSLKEHNTSQSIIYRFQKVVELLNKNNILLVTAAGNEHLNVDTENICPSIANNDNHITVASINKNKKLADFSNYGDSIDAYTDGYITLKLNNKILYLSGTSYSTAIVSARCAEFWDKYPNLSVNKVKQHIELNFNLIN